MLGIGDILKGGLGEATGVKIDVAGFLGGIFGGNKFEYNSTKYIAHGWSNQTVIDILNRTDTGDRDKFKQYYNEDWGNMMSFINDNGYDFLKGKVKDLTFARKYWLQSSAPVDDVNAFFDFLVRLNNGGVDKVTLPVNTTPVYSTPPDDLLTKPKGVDDWINKIGNKANDAAKAAAGAAASTLLPDAKSNTLLYVVIAGFSALVATIIFVFTSKNDRMVTKAILSGDRGVTDAALNGAAFVAKDTAPANKQNWFIPFIIAVAIIAVIVIIKLVKTIWKLLK